VRKLLLGLVLLCPTSTFANASNDAASTAAVAASPIDASSTQLLLVRAATWWTSSASLQRYERKKGEAWQAVGEAVPVGIGRNGMAWGRGLHVTPAKAMVKREGDHRSPAGVFALETAFGAASSLPADAHGFPYFRASSTSYCVEDKRSEHYNHLIDSNQVRPAAWEQWSELARADGLFDWAVVVRQNAPDVQKGAGSCVFLHIWRGPGRPTAGCTAMPQDRLVEVLRWLDPKRKPLLVQLPEAALRGVRESWGLP